jgi:hypothetical protein
VLWRPSLSAWRRGNKTSPNRNPFPMNAIFFYFCFVRLSYTVYNMFLDGILCQDSRTPSVLAAGIACWKGKRSMVWKTD